MKYYGVHILWSQWREQRRADVSNVVMQVDEALVLSDACGEGRDALGSDYSGGCIGSKPIEVTDEAAAVWATMAAKDIYINVICV